MATSHLNNSNRCPYSVISALIVLLLHIQAGLSTPALGQEATPPSSSIPSNSSTDSKPYTEEAVKHYNKGHELTSTGFYNQAIVEYKAAIEADARMEPAWSNLGGVYARQKNYNKAMEAFQKALALKPNSPHTLNGLASVFLARGKSEQAIATWQQAINCDPKFASAHFNIGCALENEHKDSSAVTEYYKAIAVDPNMGEAFYRIASVYIKQQHLAQARAMFAKALELGPDADYMRDAKKQLASLDSSLLSNQPVRSSRSK